MNEFIKFFDDICRIKGHKCWRLEIYYSDIMDWCISITNRDTEKRIVDVQDCDVELAFAKAQVQLKEWLLENEGGY